MRTGYGWLALLLSAPSVGHAARVDGLYISAGAGLSLMQDQTETGLLLDGVPDRRFVGRVSYDAGYVGVGALGWGFGNGLRVELEASYRYNSVSRYPGATTFNAAEQDYGGFINVLYDLDLGWPVQPYVGAGVGELTVQYKNGSVTLPNTFIRLQHENPAIAYQGILGAAIDLPIPGLALTAEYRFIAQPGEHKVYGQYFAPGIARSAEAHLTDDYSHELLVGVRYAFNAAPPPTLAEPAPLPPTRQAARTYLVFFDWDRADLTPRARQVVAQAAAASTRVAVTRIEVDGHTDSSGTAAYNQRLSVRRAQVVADELIRRGVPRDAITVQGFGETRPLIPTADGVREPQNRRVEIIFR